MINIFQRPQEPDLWHSNFLSELLTVIKPSVTVEIGIAQGETTKIFSKTSGQVFAFDIDPEAAQRVKNLRNVNA